MISILPASATPFFGNGSFRIHPIRPGVTGGNGNGDPALGPLALRSDHAYPVRGPPGTISAASGASSSPHWEQRVTGPSDLGAAAVPQSQWPAQRAVTDTRPNASAASRPLMGRL